MRLRVYLSMYVYIYKYMYTYINVWLHSFLQGDSVILEATTSKHAQKKIHFMEVGSHELLQVVNMMFC